jgi:hypothetical protein
MKKVIGGILLTASLMACQDNDCELDGLPGQ